MMLSVLEAARGAGWEALVGMPGDGPLFRRIEQIGFETTRLRCGPFSLATKSISDAIRFAVQLPRLVAQIRTLARRFGPDLLYINGPRLLPAAAVARLPIPALFHAHNYLPPGMSRRIAGYSIRELNAAVIGCCRFVAEPWTAFVPAERVTVIFNGVSGPGIATNRPNSASPRIGCIGRISPEKGQIEFLRAAALIHQGLPHSRFAIYGAPMFSPSAKEYANRVRAAVRNLPVEFPGWVDPGTAFSDLDLLLVPSAGNEGTTRVVLEAFAAGVPVVAFPGGGIPEVIEDGTGFLAANAEAMAERAIALLRGDRAVLNAVSRAARESWRRQFTLQRFQEKILRAIENAANGAPISARSNPAEASANSAAPPITTP